MIMPQMIPLALTAFFYFLIKKDLKSAPLLVIAIVGGVALYALGVLA
jgi:PTS system mannose-specific IID component/fructoselysine and glucoselysine-specific PTS system IID component